MLLLIVTNDVIVVTGLAVQFSHHGNDELPASGDRWVGLPYNGQPDSCTSTRGGRWVGGAKPSRSNCVGVHCDQISVIINWYI